MIQLAKKISWAEQELAWICRKNISKTRLWRWHLENPTGVGIWFHSVLLPAFVVAMACSIAGAEILQKMWEGPHREGVWLWLDTWDVVRLRTSSSYRNDPVKYGPHSELLLFLIRKEPVALRWAVLFEPFASTANAQGVCADGSTPFGSRRRSWIKW